MDDLRIVYRNKFVETVLFTVVAIQVFSGIKLFFNKRKKVTGFFEIVQIWSGLYLAFFLLIHLTAVLTGRFLLDLDTNFYFAAAGIKTFPLNLFFIPYYAFAIISFFGHISAVHFSKMKYNFFGMNPKIQSYVILLIGILISMLILYGFTNGFNGIELPSKYNVMIGK